MCSHLANVASDICTKYMHWGKNHEPKRTKEYILSAILISCSLAFYLFASIVSALDDTFACQFMDYVGLNTWMSAKVFMYLTFILRLRIIYKGTSFEYNPRMLLIFACVVICYALSMMVFSAFLVSASSTYAEDEDGSNARCELDTQHILYWLYMVGYLLSDLSFTVAFLVAFLKPFLESLKLNGIANHRKLIDIGFKITLSVSVALISSQLMLLGLIFVPSSLNLQWLVVPLVIDSVVNTVCLLITTPYYRNQTFYNRFCCCCLRLRRGYW